MSRPEQSSSRQLSETPLLKNLPSAVIDAFTTIAELRHLPRGAVLFYEGDQSDDLHVVLSGKIRVSRPAGDGKETVFLTVGPEDLLGELALFDGLDRHANAVAVRPSTVVTASAPDVRVWFERHPVALMRLAELLASRVRRLNDVLEDTYGLDVATRVARALVLEGARFGRTTRDGLQVDLDLSQEELALHVRASRERVNQVLADFVRRGWLARRGSSLLVSDPLALERRARFRDEVRQRRAGLTRTTEPHSHRVEAGTPFELKKPRSGR